MGAERSKAVYNFVPEVKKDIEACADAVGFGQAAFVTAEHTIVRGLASIGIRDSLELEIAGEKYHIILPFDLSNLPSKET